MLESGIKAPEIKLLNQDNQEVKLSDYLGKKVILYFYPKDNTPGCSAQACNFSELYPQFKDENAIIIGISKDSVASHKKFKEKFNLKFDILSDVELEVIKKYDVYHEKNMYGKKVMGVVRTTYLINEDGIITKAFEKVKAKDNPKDMLDILKENQN